MTNQKYKQKIDALKKKIRDIEKNQRNETRANRAKKLSRALKQLQTIGLEVTALGNGFTYEIPRPGCRNHTQRYSLSKVTYEPSKDIFYICGGEKSKEYNSRGDYHYYINRFDSGYKNSIKANSPRVNEISLGCLESLVTKAENAKKDLSILEKGGRLRRIYPAVAIETIKQRGDKGLKTGFRESSLKYSNVGNMVMNLLEYREFGAVNVLDDTDLTCQHINYRRIIFFPKLDVYLDIKDLDIKEGLGTMYLYGRKDSAKKVIRKIKENDEIHAPGGF